MAGNFAFQLSKAQHRVVAHMQAGNSVFASTGGFGPDAGELTVRQKTLDILEQRGVITVDPVTGRCELTVRGRDVSDTGYFDPVPYKQKFGSEMNDRKDKIREELIAAGHKDDGMLLFEVNRVYAERFPRGPSLRERQQEHRRQMATRVAQCPNRNISLTPEEVEYLLFRLEGVNDPVGQDLLEKLNS